MNYKNHFPYSTIRPEQDTALQFVLNSFSSGKRFVIVEAGTGVGKSAIGYTLAKTMGTPSYFLTTQKILQEQYMKDFGNLGMRSLKSASNYRCQFFKAKDCSTALREMKVSQDKRFKAACGGGCIYKKAKADFVHNNLGVTNFAYFLAETMYSGRLEPRSLLVVDEAHNIETELSKFIEITISEHFAKGVLKLRVPELKTSNQVIKWIKEVYNPKLRSVKKFMESQIEKYSLGSQLDLFVSLAKKFELIDKHGCKVDRFLEVYDKENWVMNIGNTEKTGTRKFEFKPIDISPFAEDYLFRSGEKVLMMSATIMNKDAFCQVLGINREDCEFISIPSPFPKENRPIIFSPVASMTMKNIDEGLPKLAEAVKAILAEHPNEKGIVHCHSYKIANYLKKNIRDRRLLIHDSTNRDRVLYKHTNGKQPTVLLSPSMSEGVDLKGDSSRFQILCKVPYPYLGDKLVSKRMRKWSWWYPLQTAKTIVQSVGRSIRSTEDHAVTYILDSNWGYFFKKNKDVFPEDFKSCIL